MKRHHEEMAAVSAVVPAVSVLIPITIALWIRVKEWSRKPAIDDRQ
jgi:hypothetical protein